MSASEREREREREKKKERKRERERGMENANAREIDAHLKLWAREPNRRQTSACTGHLESEHKERTLFKCCQNLCLKAQSRGPSKTKREKNGAELIDERNRTTSEAFCSKNVQN